MISVAVIGSSCMPASVDATVSHLLMVPFVTSAPSRKSLVVRLLGGTSAFDCGDANASIRKFPDISSRDGMLSRLNLVVLSCILL